MRIARSLHEATPRTIWNVETHLAMVVLLMLLVLSPIPLLGQTITDINVTGLQRTSKRIVMNTAGIRAGDEYTEALAQEAEAALWDLGIFRDVHVDADVHGDEAVVSIAVEEMWTLYGFPIFRSEINGSGTELGAGIWDSNFFGLAHRLQGQLVYSFQLMAISSLRLAYTFRNLIPKRLDASLDVSYYYDVRNTVQYQRLSLRGGATVRALSPFYGFLGSSLFLPFVGDTSGRSVEAYLDGSVGYSTLRSRSFLREGYGISLRTLGAPLHESKIHPEFRSFGSGLFYWVLGEDNLIVRAELEYANSEFFAQRMNPAYYVRGADNYSIPGNAGIQMNVEYRHLLYQTPWVKFLLTDFAFMPLAFSDACFYGDTFDSGVDGAWSLGLGLRTFARGLSTMVRVDFGVNIAGMLRGATFADSWQVLVAMEDLF